VGNCINCNFRLCHFKRLPTTGIFILLSLRWFLSIFHELLLIIIYFHFFYYLHFFYLTLGVNCGVPGVKIREDNTAKQNMVIMSHESKEIRTVVVLVVAKNFTDPNCGRNIFAQRSPPPIITSKVPKNFFLRQLRYYNRWGVVVKSKLSACTPNSLWGANNTTSITTK